MNLIDMLRSSGGVREILAGKDFVAFQDRDTAWVAYVFSGFFVITNEQGGLVKFANFMGREPWRFYSDIMISLDGKN